MTPAEMVAALPDDAPVYVPGVGEVTLGAIRGEQKPALDEEWAATLDMWGDIVTRNLRRQPWEIGASPQDIRGFHVSRFSSGRMPARSS